MSFKLYDDFNELQRDIQQGKAGNKIYVKLPDITNPDRSSVVGNYDLFLKDHGYHINGTYTATERKEVITEYIL
jgi:hypothetical protein